MVTVHDVARAAGVSIASVSRALNGQPGVGRETADRVRALAAELGYAPNEIARSLLAKRTDSVALLLPDITNPFFPELVKGVQTVADRRGVTLLLSESSDSADKLVGDLHALRRKQIDGVIIIAVNAHGSAIGEACAGIPVVALDRDLDMPEASTVGVDHEAGAYTATTHLLGLGHRRIAHIAGPSQLDVSQLRRRGWERALEEAGIVRENDLVVEGDFLETGGYSAGQTLLDRIDDFTAVFAANDLSAVGFLAACAERGVDVPDQVSVIGFDGIHLARYTTPRLTTVAQPIIELGCRAGEILLDAIADRGRAAVHEHLPTQLALGTSTDRPRDQM